MRAPHLPVITRQLFLSIACYVTRPGATRRRRAPLGATSSCTQTVQWSSMAAIYVTAGTAGRAQPHYI